MRWTGLAMAFTMVATPAIAADPMGLWQSEKTENGGYIHVKVAPCDTNSALLCGTIVDAMNDDPSQVDPERAAALVGKEIIADMEPDGENYWSNGTIWAPDEDKTYTSKMTLEGDVLEVSGCVLAGLICRGQDWTRVQ